jgi:SAM-dependent methyltransferase
MYNINNQTDYWNKVAETKTFTHPLDTGLLEQYFRPGDKILDYGCGYGRLTNELYMAGYKNITGVDTSAALIDRGKKAFPYLPLELIETPSSLEFPDESFDLILLFAVLTCIPSNKAQRELLTLLREKLKKGGAVYISDYYLQDSRVEAETYAMLDDDKNNYGVFTLPEGATFRHHTKKWISELLKEFTIVSEKTVEVKTMNGHAADAFQILATRVL